MLYLIENSYNQRDYYIIFSNLSRCEIYKFPVHGCRDGFLFEPPFFHFKESVNRPITNTSSRSYSMKESEEKIK